MSEQDGRKNASDLGRRQVIFCKSEFTMETKAANGLKRLRKSAFARKKFLSADGLRQAARRPNSRD
jgi:hypothetical protein